MGDLICYCFGYSEEDIRQDYIKNGRSLIMEKIQMEKKFGNCQCATKNPSGKGCLADVHQVVAKLKGNTGFTVIKGKDLTVINTNMPNGITTLSDSLTPLKERFNDSCNLIRFIALLSPTCPLGRDQGARAVHENVFKNYPNANISGSIIWIPILEKDNLDAALPSVRALSDQRIHHFYDDYRTVGKIIADSVGWQGNVAWDAYLFYLPNVKWTDTIPKPKFWMHQLKDEWATETTYRTGEDLKNELTASMEALFGNGSTRRLMGISLTLLKFGRAQDVVPCEFRLKYG